MPATRLSRWQALDRGLVRPLLAAVDALAAALIIFGPLLVPVAAQLGIAPLHYGVMLVIATGIGPFAPPLGLGLYGACLIGGVPIEVTVKPMLAYLSLLLGCLLVIAFVPALATWLPPRDGILTGGPR